MHRVLPLSAALLASAAVAVPAVPAAADHTLFALEIFAPEGAPAAPLCNNPRRGAQPLPAPDLPEGTVTVAVIQGTLPGGAASVTRDKGCERFRVSIGSRSFVVYESADTRVDNLAQLDNAVRVVAAQDLDTGVLVAERVVGRQVARNEIERAFLATVDVVERGAEAWTTTEIGATPHTFTFDVASAPADIEPGLGDQVAIEFDTVAPVPD